MASDSISTIIRQVPDNAQANSAAQKLIIIDPKSRSIMDKVGFWDRFSELKYLLVLNNLSSEHVIKGTKQIKYDDKQSHLSLTFNYEASCRPGNEEQVALKLFDALPGQNFVGDFIGRAFIDHIAGRQHQFLNEFGSERINIVQNLIGQASQKYSLDLKLSLDFADSELETLELTMEVQTRLKGSDDEETVIVKVELDADQQLAPVALLNKNKNFRELVTKGIRKYFAEAVSLPDYYNNLDSSQIRHGAKSYLNNLLKTYGRKVDFISLRPRVTRGTAQYSGSSTVSYKHHDYPSPVNLKVSLLMDPVDLARYKLKGSPDLKTWVDSNLNEIVQKALFGVSYIDLLLDFGRCRDRIIEEMRRRAEVIGYHLQQLITMTDLEPFQWLKGFTIEIKAQGQGSGVNSEGVFDTSVSKCPVKLDVVLGARVKDLRGITTMLTEKQNVPQRVKSEVINLIKQVLHGTDPERFYMRFSHIDRQKYPDEIPLETELRTAIAALLKNNFNAELTHLVFKSAETEITEKLAILLKHTLDFDFSVKLSNLPSSPTAQVKGNFTVEGVSHDGWTRFHERECTQQSLKKRIQDGLHSFLKMHTADPLIISDQRLFMKPLKQAAVSTKDLIQSEAGVVIKFSTPSFDITDDLGQIIGKYGREDTVNLLETISRLQSKLLLLYENDADPDEIDDHKKRINNLRAQLEPGVAARSAQLAIGAGNSTNGDPGSNKLIED